MTAAVTPIGPPRTPVRPCGVRIASDTAMDHYADLLTALSFGPLGRPITDQQGGLRFEWEHVDTDGLHWDLRAVIESSGGLYLVALGPTAAHDTDLYLERFTAAALIEFYTTGTLPQAV